MLLGVGVRGFLILMESVIWQYMIYVTLDLIDIGHAEIQWNLLNVRTVGHFMEAFLEWLVERSPAMRNDLFLLAKLHYCMRALTAFHADILNFCLVIIL